MWTVDDVTPAYSPDTRWAVGTLYLGLVRKPLAPGSQELSL